METSLQNSYTGDSRQRSRNHAMKPRPKIYITRQIPQKGIDTFLRMCNVAMWDSTEVVPQGELLKNLQGVDAVLCMAGDKIDSRIIGAAGPRLKVIGTMSDRCDHIDVNACENRGIAVVTLPHITMETVVNLTVSVILQATQKSNPLESNNNGNPPSNKVEFKGKTLGVVGLGKTGFAVAKRLKEMGVSEILYEDINVIPKASEISAKYVTFDKLIQDSDIVCLCCTSSTRTANLFHNDVFSKMKKTAILIDSTRGHSINYHDLYEALRTEVIKAAGLDLRYHGQIPNKHPLNGLNNCFFTPYREVNHTWDQRSKQSAVIAEQILEKLETNKDPLICDSPSLLER